MSRTANNLIKKKHSYGKKDANYYDLPKVNYYKSDAFNQHGDLAKVFHIRGYIRHEYQYYKSHFLSNNKLHNHL